MDFIEAAADFLLSWAFVTALWIGVLLGAWIQRVCLRQSYAGLHRSAKGLAHLRMQLSAEARSLAELKHVQQQLIQVRVRFECTACGQDEARVHGEMCDACRAVLGLTGIQKQHIFDEIKKQVEGSR